MGGGGEGVDWEAEQGAVGGVKGSDPAREWPVGPPIRAAAWFTAEGDITPGKVQEKHSKHSALCWETMLLMYGL